MKTSTSLDPRSIDPEKIYPLGEVAGFLSLGYATVLKLKNSGAFGETVSKIGKKYYVSGSAILHYMKR